MENELLKKLAHLKILFKQQTGQALSLDRMLADKAYSNEILTAAENTDNEELVLLALEIKDAFGLLAQVSEPAKQEDTDDKKYIFGARG